MQLLLISSDVIMVLCYEGQCTLRYSGVRYSGVRYSGQSAPKSQTVQQEEKSVHVTDTEQMWRHTDDWLNLGGGVYKHSLY